MPLSQEALDEVARVSEVMTVGDEFLPAAVKTECERIIPDVSYLFLKAHYNVQ